MSLLSSIGSAISNGITTKSVVSTALSVLDPSKSRLSVAGLFSGGASTNKTSVNGAQIINAQGSTPPNFYPGEKDWRVRISLPEASSFFYNSGKVKDVSVDTGSIQDPLHDTGGVVFPYTPSITVAHNARYQEQALTHSNYKNYFYEGSDVAAITITGDFTVQSETEGRYLLAAIYFFRSCTKMFYGNDTLAGNPPPIVFLDGYGDFYFPHVSCVVTNFTHTLPQDCDYVPITVGTGTSQIVRLPTTSQLAVTVQPVFSRKNVYDNFSLDKFARGDLLKGKGGFI